MYTARYLGAEGYGTISFALAFTAIFAVFTDFGLSQLIVREVARNKGLAEKYFGNVLATKFILVVLAFALVVIVMRLANYPAITVKVVYIIFLSITIGSFSTLFYSMFQAFERLEYQSIGGILTNVTMLVIALFAISHNFDVIGFAYIYLISSLVILTFTFTVFTMHHFRPRFEVDKAFMMSAFMEALPFGLTALMGMVYTYADSIMLSYFQGNEMVGWYNAAYRLVLMLLIVPNIINVTIFPVMSRYYVSSHDILSFIYRRYFKYMFVLAIPIGVGTTLLANKIILTIFGAGFVESVVALQILIWTLVLTFSGAAFIKLLESINRQAVITRISGVCVVVNILMNLVLIPRIGYIGSSITTVMTEVVLIGGIVLMTYRLGYGIPLDDFKGHAVKVLASCIAMSVFIFYTSHIHLLLLIPLSALVYFSSTYLLKVWDEEDMRLAQQVLKLGKFEVKEV